MKKQVIDNVFNKLNINYYTRQLVFSFKKDLTEQELTSLNTCKYVLELLLKGK